MKHRGPVLLLAALALNACGPADPARDQGADPSEMASVLLVTFDTSRADAFGCYGGAEGVTPVTDGLAAQGTRVERAYAAVPFTLPSHTTLLTGHPPPVHGVRTNGVQRVPAEAVTLAEHFSAAGYSTGAFVSASVLAREHGLAQGFDVYDDDLGDGAALAVPMRPAETTAARCLEWLEQCGDAPFFVWLHFFDPHTPYQTPPDLVGQFESAYLAEIHHADRNLGAVLGGLKRLGRRDTTLVCVTADHGESLGEHGEAAHGAFVYEAAVRVPLVFSGPGVGSAVLSGPRGLIDVPATLAELAGAPPLLASGESFAAAVRGGAQTGAAVYLESYVPWISFGWSPLEAVVDADWKYVDAPRPELYDLATDPAELDDRSSREPERAQRMRASLNRLRQPEPALPHADVSVSAAERRQLELLGYAVAGPIAEQELPRPGIDAGPDPKDRTDVLPLLYELFNAGAARNSGRIRSLSRKILEVDPSSPIARDYLGTELVGAKDYAAGLELLEALESSGRSSGRSLSALGVALLHTGDSQRAREVLRRAVEMRGDSEIARYWLAEAEARCGDRATAVRVLRELLPRLSGPEGQREAVRQKLREWEDER